MSYPFDATLKEILAQQAADLRQVFQLPAIEPAQTLNVDLSTLSAATDVALGFGEPIQEIADINFQSGPDPDVAARLHLYNAAFHLKYRVPVRSILVLLRPKAQTPGLDGKLSYACRGSRVNFRYDVVRLWKEPVQPFLEGGLGLLPLAPLCKMPVGKPLAESLREVVREIDRRLALSGDHARAVRLMTAAFILTGLRVRKGNVASIYEGVKIMHESVAWDEIEEEGFIKGEMQAILKLARKRWGEPDAKTLTAVNAIQDRERVERMLERMTDVKVTVKSWKGLLAIEERGGSLLGQKKYKDAEPLLKEGYEGMKQREKTMPPAAKLRLTKALERLVQLYDATGNAAEAERWRTELAARKAAQKEPKK